MYALRSIRDIQKRRSWIDCVCCCYCFACSLVQLVLPRPVTSFACLSFESALSPYFLSSHTAGDNNEGHSSCLRRVSQSERERGRTHDGEVDSEVVVPEGRERVVSRGDHLVERCNGHYYFCWNGKGRRKEDRGRRRGKDGGWRMNGWRMKDGKGKEKRKKRWWRWKEKGISPHIRTKPNLKFAITNNCTPSTLSTCSTFPLYSHYSRVSTIRRRWVGIGQGTRREGGSSNGTTASGCSNTKNKYKPTNAIGQSYRILQLQCVGVQPGWKSLHDHSYATQKQENTSNQHQSTWKTNGCLKCDGRYY